MAYLIPRGIAKRNIVRQHPLHRNRLFFKTRTIISYIRIPNVHQSTAAVWPCAAITSGAMYSAISPNSASELSDQLCDLQPSVPTKEFVRKLAVHVIVSTIGIWFKKNKYTCTTNSPQFSTTYPIVLRLHHRWHSTRPIGLFRQVKVRQHNVPRLVKQNI